MSFRPIDETAFAADRALSAEHGRRIARDTAEIISERCVQSGGAFRRYAGDGSELRTLWRWAANWGYIGPFEIFVPPQVAEQGFVRMLIGARTNGGDGNVRVYAINEAMAPDEATMTTDTASGAPGSESSWYVCESDVGASDFDFALLMPVLPGWNQCWIAILCDADADRTPVAASGDDVVATVVSASGITLPVVDFAGSTFDAVGAAIELATDATAYAAGQSTRYTIAASSDFGNGSRNVVWEPSLREWIESVQDQPPGYAVRFYTVPLFIDSISLDGSVSATFNAAAFRYLQFVSAGFTRAATDGAQNAHLARLPLFGSAGQLFGAVPAALDDTRGVPARAFILSPTTTLQTIGAACLGIASGSLAIDVQQTFSGVYVYEVRVNVFAKKLRALRTGDSPVNFEFVADVVDAAGSSIALGDTVPVVISPIINTVETGAPLATQTQSWITPGATTGVLYGQESVVLRGDLGAWVSVSCRVSVPSSLSTEPVQRLRMRARTPDGTIAGLSLVVSPITVRLTDGN